MLVRLTALPELCPLDVVLIKSRVRDRVGWMKLRRSAKAPTIPAPEEIPIRRRSDVTSRASVCIAYMLDVPSTKV